MAFICPTKTRPAPFAHISPLLSSYHHRSIHITRNTFYLITLSHGNQAQAPACWFVKTRDRTDRVKMQMLDPFSDYNPKPLPENFPNVLDLSHFQVLYLKGFSACGLMRVFDLETGAASPLGNWPAYCDLFWPPPQWVSCAESVISSAQVTSNSSHPITSAGREAGTPSSKCSFTRTH
ncbi:hypothetical protein GQ457_10G023790 [Hibiscus cannabinus]